MRKPNLKYERRVMRKRTRKQLKRKRKAAHLRRQKAQSSSK